MKKATPLFLILLTGLALYSCKQKATQTSSVPAQELTLNRDLPGHIRLFDGQTLNSWEKTNFGPQGEVYVSGDMIVMNMGDGCTGINYTGSFPRMNYEVTLEAMRISGTDFFCGITFPINDAYCSFIVGGWAGVVVGLSTIDGKDGAENETTRMMHFNTNEWYKIRLRVKEAKISAWINDEQVIDFAYEGKDLNIRPEVSLSIPFGIATWKTTGAVRNLYVKRFENS